MKNTYYVMGLTEYRMRLQPGPVGVDVEFTGGVVNGYGVTPATYETDDPIIQRLLEASAAYRSGRIRKL